MEGFNNVCNTKIIVGVAVKLFWDLAIAIEVCTVINLEWTT